MAESRDFVWFASTVCNLHCEFCNTADMKPYMATLDEAKRFYDNTLQEGDEVVIAGGEPTMIDLTVLEDIISLFSQKAVLVLLTNGYGLLELDEAILKKLDWVQLDDHGPNSKHVVECVEKLSRLNVPRQVLSKLRHISLTDAVEESQGAVCPPGFPYGVHQGLIYPCCVAMSLDAPWLAGVLSNLGWTIDNPAWEPGPIGKRFEEEVCKKLCYHPHATKARRVQITTKPNDKIRRKGR